MISCANHDYVEIACMYGFEVKLVFKNGQIIQGKALQTSYSENKEEGIVIKTEFGDKEIVLAQLAAMVAVTKNPHFGKVDFG